jgi:hypothetical protein
MEKLLINKFIISLIVLKDISSVYRTLFNIIRHKAYSNINLEGQILHIFQMSILLILFKQMKNFPY